MGVTVKYERRSAPPATRATFLRRMFGHLALVVAVLAGSLGGGMLGYAHYEGLSWRDAFLNAAMLLGGMGPVNAPVTDAGKLFAGIYALYAGLVFILVAGIIATPLAHRLLHQFHWDEGEGR